MGYESLLKNVYLFKQFSPSEIEKVSEGIQLLKLPAKAKVFSENDKATALYVISFGSVAIQQKSDTGEKIEVAVLGIGSHFGEMAFIDGELRSASAVCMEPSEIIKLSYVKLENLISKDFEMAARLYKELAYFLAGRLRVTTNDLSFSREKNLSYF